MAPPGAPKVAIKEPGIAGVAAPLETGVIDKHGGFQYSASVCRSMHRSSDPGPDRSRRGANHPFRVRSAGRDGLHSRRGGNCAALNRVQLMPAPSVPKGVQSSGAAGNAENAKIQKRFAVNGLAGMGRPAGKCPKMPKFTSEATAVHGWWAGRPLRCERIAWVLTIRVGSVPCQG